MTTAVHGHVAIEPISGSCGRLPTGVPDSSIIQGNQQTQRVAFESIPGTHAGCASLNAVHINLDQVGWTDGLKALSRQRIRRVDSREMRLCPSLMRLMQSASGRNVIMHMDNDIVGSWQEAQNGTNSLLNEGLLLSAAVGLPIGDGHDLHTHNSTKAPHLFNTWIAIQEELLQ